MSLPAAKREQHILNEYQLLQQLASPNQYKQADISDDNRQVLEMKHDLKVKYGRVDHKMKKNTQLPSLY